MAEKRGDPCSAKTLKLFGRCDCKATVEREGVWYCWMHDPERVRAKRRVRTEQLWDEARRRAAKHEAEWKRADLLRESGIRDLTDQDLEQIVAAGGIWAFLPWRPGETDSSVDD